MKTIILSYKQEWFIHPITKKTEYVYRPIVPLRLGYGGKILKFQIDCLLDSGADENLFPASLTHLLNINLKKGLWTEHIGIGGSSEIAYRHSVNLFLGTYKIRTTVDFSQTHTVPLLGRNAFFAFFKSITFREKDHKVEISY